FGGPLGLGAVIDVKGDDLYQCGERFPSVYNPTEAPTSKPGDEQFQYDCFGIGTGSGKRVLTAATKKPQDSYNLAGGWGMVLDLAGTDRYRSSNFSQGCGYFFGIGLKLDLAGNDDHVAARYSHASGAHHGIGLFIDAHGEDHYASTGPVYNGAAAWDFSVMLAIDADQDNDLYELQRSTGLGEADHHAWGVFIEEGGADRYLIGGGMGTTSDNSVSIFFDLGGLDTYEVAATANAAKSNKQSNGRVLLNKSGGMFFDR
ncbi:MAG: hypothetical protein ACT4OO_15190, partial [Nitrospiraceae bacterium]